MNVCIIKMEDSAAGRVSSAPIQVANLSKQIMDTFGDILLTSGVKYFKWYVKFSRFGQKTLLKFEIVIYKAI